MLAGKCFNPLAQPWYMLLNDKQTQGNNNLCAFPIKFSVDSEYVAYTKLSIAAQVLVCLVPVGTSGLDLEQFTHLWAPLPSAFREQRAHPR